MPRDITGAAARLAIASVVALAAGGGCARGPFSRPAHAPPVATPGSPGTGGERSVAATEATRHPYEGLRDSLAAAPSDALRGRLILLDPGHGGHYDGVVGAEGLREADVNLAVALTLDSLLTAAGATVHLTRDADREVALAPGATLRDDLIARRAMADSLRPDLFLSIHHNSSLPLDRKRDTSDIFFRLNDEGPSLDAARWIHRSLVRNLGLPPGSFTAANYLLLRGTGPPAVLSEASYLSDPAIEARLRTPEAIRLEAEAYYIGLAAWFAAGIPGIHEDIAATAGDETGPTPAFRLLLDAPGGLDAASLSARIDDAVAVVDLDPDLERAWVRPAHPLGAGAHRLEVALRNMTGNASPRYIRDFRVNSPSAAVILSAEPAVLPAADTSCTRVSVRVLDRFGNPCADGTPLRFAVRNGHAVEGAPVATHEGKAEIHVIAPPGRAPIRVHAWFASGDTARLAIPRRATGSVLVWGRVTGDDGAAAPAATVRRDNAAPIATDDSGWFMIEIPGVARAVTQGGPSQAVAVVASAPGFESAGVAPAPFRDSTAATRCDFRLRRVRESDGLRGLRVVLDPAAGGDDPGSVSADGDQGKAAALRFARRLDWVLGEAGARVTLTRDGDASTSAVARVRVAEAAPADVVIRIDARSGAPGMFATVSHYPGSAAGTVLADSIGSRLAQLGWGKVATGETAVFTIQQVSAPAVDIALHIPGDLDVYASFPDSAVLAGATRAIREGMAAARPAGAGASAAGASAIPPNRD